MNPIDEVITQLGIENKEAFKKVEKDSPSVCSRITNLAEDIFAKYLLGSMVTKLNSTLEIKQSWLYNEWELECQFSKYIRRHFPIKGDLDPKHLNSNIKLIQSTFDCVRGKWALWQTRRETAKWKKIEVTCLKLEWVVQNTQVLYPSEDRFEVSELKGIVLWEDKESTNNKRCAVYEGNHRISAWLAAQVPKTMPAVLFIGKPAK